MFILSVHVMNYKTKQLLMVTTSLQLCCLLSLQHVLLTCLSDGEFFCTLNNIVTIINIISIHIPRSVSSVGYNYFNPETM